jgi:putative endonuclease
MRSKLRSTEVLARGKSYRGFTTRHAGSRLSRAALAPAGMTSLTRRYGVKTLVDIEFHDTMDGAISREKSLKRWQRAWKIKMIEKANPSWRDLFPEMTSLTAHRNAMR